MESFYFKEAIERPTRYQPAFVVIPGNPGLMDFYITYITLLQKDFPTFDILILGNLFEEKPNEERVLYGLEYQINHKIESVLKYIHSKDKNVHLYFLTHSIGSYIGQNMVKRLISDHDLKTKLAVKFVGLMFPTIQDIAKSQSGVLFSSLSSRVPLASIASAIVRVLNIVLPDVFLEKLVRTFFIAKPKSRSETAIASWNNSVQGAMHIAKSPQIVWQIIALATEEMHVVRENKDLNDWFFSELPRNDSKIWMIYAEDDHWVHPSTRNSLINTYPGARVSINEESVGFVHSFCVNQSEEAYQITSSILKEVVPDIASY